MLKPDSWAELYRLQVLDPDGWRVDGQPWDTFIEESEFRRRVALSTVRAYGYPGTAL